MSRRPARYRGDTVRDLLDWSQETITLQGLPVVIKAAHMKLLHSRVPFVRAIFVTPARPMEQNQRELNVNLFDDFG